MRRRKLPVFPIPFITLTLFDAELQRLLSMMGSLVRFFGGSCALKTLPRWIRTGDKVIIDKNDDMFIVDRIKVGSFCPLLVHAKGVAAYVGNFEGPRLSSGPC